MATTQTTPNGEAIPVYLSFTTFRSAVQSLRTHGLPDKLDRTAWASRSGGEQNQIINAFKFLGLIDGSENTQPSLKKLVDAQENTEQEKTVISALLHEKYKKMFAMNLETATAGQVADAIGSYGPTGATRDRAVRFFLKAAYHCGVPLSSRLTAGMRSKDLSDPSDSDDTGPIPQPTPRRRRRRASVNETPEQQENEISGKAVKTIDLRETSGSLTLSGTFNAFDLAGEERKLVYDIIDLMKTYEQKKGKASE
jgi:hypothetical protein